MPKEAQKRSYPTKDSPLSSLAPSKIVLLPSIHATHKITNTAHHPSYFPQRTYSFHSILGNTRTSLYQLIWVSINNHLWTFSILFTHRSPMREAPRRSSPLNHITTFPNYTRGNEEKEKRCPSTFWIRFSWEISWRLHP